jgi:uncharacterized damage-inducible protein DinB
MITLPYAQLINIKRWADHGLYETARQNLEALGPGNSFIMRRILDHIQVVDRIFQHHLQGRPHGYSQARSEDLPEFETLAERARELDAWYVAYVGKLRAAAFDEPLAFTFTSGKPGRMTRGQVLLHVCLHGVYHRGNAGAVLQLRGLTPSPDAVTDYLEAARSGAAEAAPAGAF